MGKYLLIASLTTMIAACAGPGERTRDYLLKNPDVVFEVIEKNPEAFMASVEKAAHQARASQAEKRQREMAEQAEMDLKNPKKPKLDVARRLTGSPSSPIVIVEYADFQCPACAMAHRSLRQIKKKYGDRVQFHFKNMPLDFHPQAEPASRAFEAVRLLRPARALEVYDLMFEKQSQLASPDFIGQVAKKAGLTETELRRKMKSPEVDALIRADMDEFIGFGFTGTPVVLVNGVALYGAHPPESIEAMIERTLKK